MYDIESTLNRDAFRRVCTMPELEFGHTYDMQKTYIDQPGPENYYFFADHGSNVLAVAHLDTVGAPDQRDAHFMTTEAGEVVYSRALDDRLGAYIILEWLPAMGIQYDVLLTVGEESGQSTAVGFDAPPGKTYDWIIEFDRGGTDVVLYQYEDETMIEAVKASGARVGDGIFSDISYMEHLGVKAINWGVGYRDYHGPRAHAYLEDTYMMLEHYLRFHDQNEGRSFIHVEGSGDDDWPSWGGSRSRSLYSSYGSDDAYADEEDIFEGSYDDDGYWIAPDWIEHPTSEEMQAFEARMAAEEERTA